MLDIIDFYGIHGVILAESDCLVLFSHIYIYDIPSDPKH